MTRFTGTPQIQVEIEHVKIQSCSKTAQAIAFNGGVVHASMLAGHGPDTDHICV